MSLKVRDVMTPDPVTLPRTTTIAEAARVMRDQGIGDVLVMDGERLCGMVTDRDIVVRVLAEDLDPRSTEIGQFCTRDLVSVSPDQDSDEVVSLMRGRAVRRIPVLQGERPVGIVTIGDMAIERDRDSALADISAAPPTG